MAQFWLMTCYPRSAGGRATVGNALGKKFPLSLEQTKHCGLHLWIRLCLEMVPGAAVSTDAAWEQSLCGRKQVRGARVLDLIC